MSIHSGEPRSLSLHQTQPTVSAGQKLVVGTGGKGGRENLEWSAAVACLRAHSTVCLSKWA